MGIIRSNADLEGDTKPMTDAGTKTGMNGTDYGYDTGVDATNPCGNIAGVTKSDTGDQVSPCMEDSTTGSEYGSM